MVKELRQFGRWFRMRGPIPLEFWLGFLLLQSSLASCTRRLDHKQVMERINRIELECRR